MDIEKTMKTSIPEKMAGAWKETETKINRKLKKLISKIVIGIIPPVAALSFSFLANSKYYTLLTAKNISHAFY